MTNIDRLQQLIDVDFVGLQLLIDVENEFANLIDVLNSSDLDENFKTNSIEFCQAQILGLAKHKLAVSIGGASACRSKEARDAYAKALEDIKQIKKRLSNEK